MFQARIFALLAASALVLGAQSADKAKAIQLVKDAAAYGQANGKDKLFKEVSMVTGKFHVASEQELYILIYDLNGVCTAHGFRPNQIGTNRFEVKDKDGKAFIQEFIKIAKEKGKGWVDYKFENPATKKLEPKSTYVELWNNHVIGCGIYK
jgi:signal transduction histidine kinase